MCTVHELVLIDGNSGTQTFLLLSTIVCVMKLVDIATERTANMISQHPYEAQFQAETASYPRSAPDHLAQALQVMENHTPSFSRKTQTHMLAIAMQKSQSSQKTQALKS